MKTYKVLLLLLLAVIVAASFLYLEFPLAVLRPVFFNDKINLYSEKYGVDPLLVAAIIKTESNFSKTAKSPDGAIGLMQLMPSTAKELSQELGYKIFTSTDLVNPELNIELGIYYISKLSKEFHDNQILTLAAYNAGLGKVQQWYMLNPMLEIDVNDIPYAETREYIKSVQTNYKWLKWIRNLRSLIRRKTH